MARKSASTVMIAIAVFLGIDAAVGAFYCWQYMRVADAGIETLDSIRRASIPAEPPQAPPDAAPMPHVDRNDRALRSAASHAVRAEGLGSLIVGSVKHQGGEITVSGTAVGQDDSVPVEVRLVERRNAGGVAFYSGAKVRRR
jgi:hypothetical protein